METSVRSIYQDVQFYGDDDAPYCVEIQPQVYKDLCCLTSTFTGANVVTVNDAIALLLEKWQERSGKELTWQERSAIFHTDGGVFPTEVQ